MERVGLDYFSMDVDFFQDDKIKIITNEFGCPGECIVIRIMMKLYRNGYYLEWNGNSDLLIALDVKCDPLLVKQVVETLLDDGFFNKKVFEKYKILTSKGFQRRYFEAVKRRKFPEIIKEYLLTKLPNHEEMYTWCIHDVDSVQHDVVIKESKVNKSKVNKSKVKESTRETSIQKPKPVKVKYADYVKMTETQYEKLVSEHGIEKTKKFIDKLNYHKGATGKTYKDDYLAIHSWVIDAVNKNGGTTQTPVDEFEPYYGKVPNVFREGEKPNLTGQKLINWNRQAIINYKQEQK